MVEEAETKETAQETAKETEYYDLHIKVVEEMRPVLKKAANLAYKLELIPKPELSQLFNLFINLGMAILKQRWLDKMGYK